MGLKKRIGAFLLCGVIAFHSVCIYTPPAKAAVLESMLANMCLSTFMTATGISLVPDDKTSESLGQALDDLVDQFIPDYQLEVPDFTEESWYTALAADTVILDTGFVRIGSGAAALLGKFTGWLIDKFDLIGEDGAPVTEPVRVFSDAGFPMKDGSLLYVYGYPVGSEVYTPLTPGVYYYTETGQVFGMFEKADGTIDCYLQSWAGASKQSFEFGTTKFSDIEAYYLARASNGRLMVRAKEFGNDTFYGYTLGGGYTTGVSGLGTVAERNVDATISPHYEAPPKVEEQYSMVIGTGVTYENEQSFIDSILAGAAVGALSPTYSIEQTTPGDVTVPDEGEDTDDEQGGILDWTKKIWQSVVDLPKSIAGAIADVFVPSAEYLEALPATVAATFDGRTGFLTYPISVLADFVGRLNDTGNDWIIEWPDIYEPFSNGRLISKGQFNVSEFVRSDQTISSIYSTWMLITKAFLIFMFLDLCSKKYSSVIGDRLE